MVIITNSPFLYVAVGILAVVIIAAFFEAYIEPWYNKKETEIRKELKDEK